MVDNIPPEFAIPAAIILTIVWLITVRLQNRER